MDASHDSCVITGWLGLDGLGATNAVSSLVPNCLLLLPQFQGSCWVWSPEGNPYSTSMNRK